jgi:hypothetical protein
MINLAGEITQWLASARQHLVSRGDRTNAVAGMGSCSELMLWLAIIVLTARRRSGDTDHTGAARPRTAISRVNHP